MYAFLKMANSGNTLGHLKPQTINLKFTQYGLNIGLTYVHICKNVNRTKQCKIDIENTQKNKS